MDKRKRLLVSILLLTATSVIAAFWLVAFLRVPVLEETIRLSADGIRDWTETAHYGSGRQTGWRVIAQELPVCVLKLPDGSCLLRYIEWNYEPARGFRRFLLPAQSQILGTFGASPGLRAGITNVQWTPRSAVAGKIDLSVRFRAPDNSVATVEAAPPLTTNGTTTFRVPASLVQFQRSLFIRGDFTGWKSLPMESSGDVFVFRTNLAPGKYRYQFQYSYLAFGDPSVPGALTNADGESVSEIVINPGAPSTNGK
jgi:hypothetical protein